MKIKRDILIVMILLVFVSLSSCVALRPADGISDSGENAKAPRSDEGYITVTSDVSKGQKASAVLEVPAPPPDPYIGVSVSLTAAGDNLIHPNIYTDAYTRGRADKRYDFLPVYTDVAEMIMDADIAFINEETVMAGEGYGYSGWPCFNAPRELGDDLVSLGFDVVNVANNHMLDMGTQGLLDTLDFWHTKPVTLIGGYTDPDDYAKLRITEQGGIKIAWLAYTYGTNGIVKAGWFDAVIPYIDDDTIVSDIKRAEEAADFVIVSVHWGDENITTPNDEQRRLARLMAENGADLILGHHPHVLQPIEWIETDEKSVLCAYSLGNFISGMTRPTNAVGGLLSLDIVGDGDGGLTVDNILFTPTVFWYGMDWYGTHLYLLDDFTDELASTCGVRIDGYSITVDSAKKIVTDVIAAEYLPEYLK